MHGEGFAGEVTPTLVRATLAVEVAVVLLDTWTVREEEGGGGLPDLQAPSQSKNVEVELVAISGGEPAEKTPGGTCKRRTVRAMCSWARCGVVDGSEVKRRKPGWKGSCIAN